MKDLFYISKSGEVRWNKFPEEPDPGDYEPCSSRAANEMWAEYQQSLQDAKDSSIEVSENEKWLRWLYTNSGYNPIITGYLNWQQSVADSLHPFPLEQYEVEVREERDQLKCHWCKIDCLQNLKGISCKAPITKVAVIKAKSEPVLNEGKGERPIEELFVEKYYGLSPDCDENGKINTDYGDLVNLLTMFKEETKLTAGYNKAIDDVLMVMCINPYHADPAEAEIYGQAIKDKVSEIQRMRK